MNHPLATDGHRWIMGRVGDKPLTLNLWNGACDGGAGGGDCAHGRAHLPYTGYAPVIAQLWDTQASRVLWVGSAHLNKQQGEYTDAWSLWIYQKTVKENDFILTMTEEMVENNNSSPGNENVSIQDVDEFVVFIWEIQHFIITCSVTDALQ